MNGNQKSDAEKGGTDVTIYHRRFEDPDNPGERHEKSANIGMGWVVGVERCGIDVENEDTFDEIYEKIKSIHIHENVDESFIYSGWENGNWHDPEQTRSMAVGDIIVVDGQGYFIDNIGFEKVNIKSD